MHKLTLDKLSIPGFTRVHYIGRDATSNGKGSGGLALFCKLSLSKYVTPVTRSCCDVIWVKISKELCGVDTFLGTIYVSPSGNKANISKKFQTMGEDIIHFQRKGENHFARGHKCNNRN